MNELQRQQYLASLGLETYMPRWCLPYAPSSVLCQLPKSQPLISLEKTVVDASLIPENKTPINLNNLDGSPVITSSPISSLIGDIFSSKKIKREESAAPIVEFSDAKIESVATIDGFSLSVWRPFENLMIIDSRNTQLALPTELLLNNIVQKLFPDQRLHLSEEVMRWPMIENSFAKRTIEDAKAELQTWISVQCEIRPIKYLWLMGDNAAIYFLHEGVKRKDCLWRSSLFLGGAITALILPSLNELLQQPLQKQQLFSALQRYHI